MMTQRYFIQLSYKGTNYHGWQIQPNAISVQEVVEKALSTVLRETIEVVGAGRTDTGVHASFYVLHFEVLGELSNFESLVYKLNSLLPYDISIQKVWPVAHDLHARFSAVSRTYKYYISTKKNPFRTETSFKYLLPLNIDVKTNNCKILWAEWVVKNTQIIFTIKADRFLRNMVRAIVGTLLEVGKGKLSIKEFRKIIEAKDRAAAGPSAPAKGLFLVDVEYPEGKMLE